MAECVHCGRTVSGDELTDDHVPPKSFFADPKPADLIEVPACKRCNKGWQRDGDYFRLVVSAREDLVSHDAAQAVLEKAIRGVLKPEAAGMRTAFLRKLQLRDRRTPAGLILGQGVAVEADDARLERVVERTVAGLYYHHFGGRVPEGWAVSAWRFGARTLAGQRELLKGLAAVAAQPMHSRGGDTFQYKFATAHDEATATGWLLRFYGRVVFGAVTLPVESIERSKRVGSLALVAP